MDIALSIEHQAKYNELLTQLNDKVAQIKE
jgi:hypothetical protein